MGGDLTSARLETQALAMKATDFEYRHQNLFHLLLVGLALLTYLVNPDDIVWALVRRHSNRASLERIAFAAGTFVMISSAVLETWGAARAQLSAPALDDRRSSNSAHWPLRLSRLLLASALGLLLPWSGALVLIAGEAVLVFRLVLRDRENAAPAEPIRTSSHHDAKTAWGRGFRTALSKWGLAISMVLFTLTLQDRIVELGCAISFLAWLAVQIRLPA